MLFGQGPCRRLVEFGTGAGLRQRVRGAAHAAIAFDDDGERLDPIFRIPLEVDEAHVPVRRGEP